MEFEDVDEQMEREARRVASAFEVECFNGERGGYWCEINQTNIGLGWEIEEDTNQIVRIACIEIGEDDGCAVNWDEDAGWWLEPNTQFHEFIARGLYRLGIEDEDILAQLNHPFTAHEKLELRLSMPREFWPKKWKDEESGDGG